jgi:hypothetical protein
MLIIVQVHDTFFSLYVLNKYEILKVLIPCKFSVSSFKMITISNHNQNLIFKILMFSCIINNNFKKKSCTLYHIYM